MRIATDKSGLYNHYRQLKTTFQIVNHLPCHPRYFSASATVWKKGGLNRYARRLKEKHLKVARTQARTTEESTTATPERGPESKVPDHRDIGTAYNLFTSSSYSPGSPLFHPNGAHIFNKLISFLRAQYPQFGIEEVITPTIYKQSLWERSGHSNTYANAMYQVEAKSASDKTSKEQGTQTVDMESKAEKADDVHTREDEVDDDESVYGLKPMNCPGHCLLYNSIPRSYRDLPIRYVDFSTLHRNEDSGSLTGLTHLRRFHQDDGNIFCRPSQVQSEIARTLAFVQLVYKKLGMGKYKLVLSTRPEGKFGEALGRGFIGAIEVWDQAEAQLREVLDATGRKWDVAPGEAAFHGPKIDALLQDASGKWHQMATIQLDFQMPRRFGLKYATTPKVQLRDKMFDFDLDNTKNGNEETHDPESHKTAAINDAAAAADTTLTAPNQATPVLIRRAILGSVERFLALLLEHYNGTFPFWLSPRPVILLSVSQGSATIAYIRKLAIQLSGYSLVSAHSTASLSLKPPLLSASSKRKLHKPKNKANSKRKIYRPNIDDLATAAADAAADAAATDPDFDPEPDSSEDILLLSNPTAQSLLHARVPIRVDVDVSAVELGRKIKAAKKQGYNHILVVGPADVEKGTVQVEIWNQCVKRDMQGRLMTQTPAPAPKQRTGHWQTRKKKRDGVVDNNNNNINPDLQDLHKVQRWLAEAAMATTKTTTTTGTETTPTPKPTMTATETETPTAKSADNNNDGHGEVTESAARKQKLGLIRKEGHVKVQATALRSYFERLIDEYM